LRGLASQLDGSFKTRSQHDRNPRIRPAPRGCSNARAVTPRWRRSPRPIGLALERAGTGWAPETLLAEVQRVWSNAVGPAIAAEATPASERGGVLTVSCSASVWAQELDLMAPAILERLNEGLRSGHIGRLRCVAVPLSEDPFL
jgi:predicted nucleic acid-binding Zn ribbon protein